MEALRSSRSTIEKWIGHVVGPSGDNLIVEHGHLRHHRTRCRWPSQRSTRRNKRVDDPSAADMVDGGAKADDGDFDELRSPSTTGSAGGSRDRGHGGARAKRGIRRFQPTADRPSRMRPRGT